MGPRKYSQREGERECKKKRGRGHSIKQQQEKKGKYHASSFCRRGGPRCPDRRRGGEPAGPCRSDKPHLWPPAHAGRVVALPLLFFWRRRRRRKAIDVAARPLRLLPAAHAARHAHRRRHGAERGKSAGARMARLWRRRRAGEPDEGRGRGAGGVDAIQCAAGDRGGEQGHGVLYSQRGEQRC